MSKSIFQNCSKPEGFWGKVIVNGMNSGHAPMAKWGFSHISPAEHDSALDIGCGGGANIARLCDICTRGYVAGLDYSEVSVEKSKKVNKAAIDAGRCEIIQGSAAQLPFEDNKFDIATAFETVYFWGDLKTAFAEAYRVLKSGGVFMICNAADGTQSSDEMWTSKIDGMTVYRSEEIIGYLRDAGFSDIKSDTNDKHWLCVTAAK